MAGSLGKERFWQTLQLGYPYDASFPCCKACCFCHDNLTNLQALSFKPVQNTTKVGQLPWIRVNYCICQQTSQCFHFSQNLAALTVVVLYLHR